MRAATMLAGILAGILALTACSTSEAGRAAPAPTTARPKPKPAPTLPAAANGTNLASCASGACEVKVSGPVSIPVAATSGVTSLAVTSIDPKTVGLEVTLPAGQMSADCTDPDCGSGFVGVAAGGDTVTGTAAPHSGATYTVNHLAVRVVAIVGGAAVLRLAPA